MTSPGERRLVARILGGGPVALGVLYDLFGPVVHEVVHEVVSRPVADEGAVRAVTRSSRDARGRGGEEREKARGPRLPRTTSLLR